QAYHKAERVWQLTGQLAPTTTQLWPKAEVLPLPLKRKPRRRWWLGAAVAACLLVAVAPNLSLRLQADYRTAQGEARDITLADGS
ncbi:FecR family protein, partial [Pseudomonas syringae]